MPTRVRMSSSVSIPSIEIARPKSGLWKKVVTDDREEPFPLVVRHVRPESILDVMRAPARPLPSPPRTMDVLPWDIEVVEDQRVLRAMLAPPVIFPMPVLPLATKRAPLPTRALVVLATFFGITCAALGFFAVLVLSR